MHKFPRTRHLQGSRFQYGDHDLEAVPFEELVGKRLVVEEKLDGAQSGISFDEEGKLLLQSRGHYLRGGPREKHFDLLKQWASARQEELRCLLGSRYVMYGEWMYACHTVFYDALPHYFMEFDVLDLETNEFLSTPRRDHLLRFASDVTVPVKVLTVGEFKTLKELQALIKRSNFITEDREYNFLNAARQVGVIREGALFQNEEEWHALGRTDLDPRMEGLYVKWEDEHRVLGRYKFVRDTFTNAILDQEEHWHARPIIQNRLEPGAYARMFE
jgi:hypothetical protein